MSVSRLSARDNHAIRRNTPPPDLFGSGFVIKVGDAWQISSEGRAYLNDFGDGRFVFETAPASEAAIARSVAPLENATLADHPQMPLTVIPGKPGKSKIGDASVLDQMRLPPARTLPRRLRIAGRR